MTKGMRQLDRLFTCGFVSGKSETDFQNDGVTN